LTNYFSIIIPTYNSETTLSECLDSIFCQTFNNLEVWVIDGVSTDETLLIIKEYCTKYNNLHYVSEPDKGIYDAMNKGIKLSNGEWLYFLGSDDSFYDSKVLQNVSIKLNSIKCDIVYGDVFFVNSNRVFSSEFSLEKLLFEHNVCHQSIFYNKSVFEKNGYFNLKYPLWADYDFNIRCLKNDTLSIKYIDLVIACYNDGMGKSGKQEDLALKRELPIYYLNNHYKLIQILAYVKKNRVKSIIKILFGLNL
jgi:glycosyltransferase involved in cell wall biosynthesis